MKKCFTLLLLLCIAIGSKATDYYWVGGAGDWSDINHWATTSGGSVKHSIVPSENDDVYFNASSGLVAGSNVYLPSAGHAYCRNMSWAGVTAVVNLRNPGSFWLYVSGNLELAASVRYGWMRMQFTGSGNATFKTNGAARYPVAGWYNPVEINKPGGSVKLLDNIPAGLVVTGVTLTAGTLDLSNGYHDIQGGFTLNSTNARTLNITNATILVSTAMDARGTNLTLLNDNSFISTNTLYSSGYYFPRVEIKGNGNDMVINNTGFGELLFSNTTSLPGMVRIGSGNTIRKLEFKSSANIRAGGNVIDSLILAPSKRHYFFLTNTINKYFKLNSANCSGLGELYAEDGSTATLNMPAGVELDLLNVYIRNMVVGGTVTVPIAVQGADGSNNTGWEFNTPAAGTTLYWVGGAGDWNDASHWSNMSGGTGGYCIPFSADNVVFDANSGFTTTSNIVTSNANAWCHNMTWTGVTSAPVFNKNASFIMEVWGSIALSPAVTMNAEMLLRGEEASTLTSNGNTLGNLRLIIQKTGTNGGISLSDDLLNTNTFIRLSSGKFLLPDKKLHITEFVSSGGVRTIDITNATITTEYGWTLTGTGRTWINNAAGSSITSTLHFVADGLVYPQVTLTAANGNFAIANATIGTLLFTSTSAVSIARIGSNNTITQLDFKGAGGLYGSNNTIGELLLAPSRNYTFTGTNTINQRFRFNSASCTGLGEMKGLNDVTATLNFGASVTLDLANIYIQNITANGAGITPIIVTGADAGGNTGFNFISAAGSARYWVGGSGDWNDASHWSLTSGGTTGACIPTVSDNVYFDANSFVSGGKTITTSGNSYCRDMNWTGSTNSPVFNKTASFNVEVWGNLTLSNTVTINGIITMKGGTSNTIYMNGNTLGDLDFVLDKQGGSIALNGTINNTLTSIVLTRGALDISGKTMVLDVIDDIGQAYATSLNISNAVINAKWRYTGANKNLIATGSSITASIFFSNGSVYNNVNVTANNSVNLTITGTTFNNLLFSNTATNSTVYIGAGNTIGTLEFKGRGAVTGTGNVMDTLILSPGRIYTFTNGTNTVINKALYGSGTPCNLTEIVSSSTTANATITKTNGSVALDYIRIRRITAGGVTPFTAEAHSIDQGNNVNWNIAPYNSSAPIEGLGPDVAVESANFPYTLKTDGFFASPMASYLWNNGSTGKELVISGPGTYSVTVSFPDGCSISDQIVVTRAIPLPITLESFTVRENTCRAIVQWKVSNAVNFERFEVERSTDDNTYISIAQIVYTKNTDRYTFTDENVPGNSLVKYRLKMIDQDDAYKFSAVAAVRMTCTLSETLVYPTVTSSEVNIRFAPGNQKASVMLMNASGQLLKNIATSGNTFVTVNVAELPAGTYLLVIDGAAGRKVHRFVKK